MAVEGLGRRTPERYAWEQMSGRRSDLSSSIGRQRARYGGEIPTTMMGLIHNHIRKGIGPKRKPMVQKPLNRRFHSGGMNMLNRRDRVKPRQVGGAPRLSKRNTQPNKGTFGIGQGINR